MKRLKVVAPLLLIAIASCTDSDLVKVAKTLDAVAISTGELQTFSITSNQQGLMTEATNRTILKVCEKVNLGGKQATEAVKKITKLTPADRKNLIKIISPIVEALNASISQEVIPISDVPTRQRVQLLLLSIQSSLNTISLVLAGGS